MAPKDRQILPLPPEVVAQIRSSAAITSLNSTVLELLKNSLDAGARTIVLEVDHRRGGCTVEDDGHGIIPAEFEENGGLGRLHCTSKHNHSSETYGQGGAFLPSLASLSLLTITSQHRSHKSRNTIILHHSNPISRLIPSPDHQRLSLRNHGTRVAVHDLFGNIPVRVKQRVLLLNAPGETEKEWEDLRKRVVALLLAWGKPITLKMADRARRRRLTLGAPNVECSRQALVPDASVGKGDRIPTFDISYIKLLFFQSGYTASSETGHWKTVSARSPHLSIRGAISLEPAATKQSQFLSLGMHPVDSQGSKSVLYEEINRFFTLSNFGALEDEPEIDQHETSTHNQVESLATSGQNNKQLRGGGKGVDKWPVFYLRIDTESQHLTTYSMGEGCDHPKFDQAIQQVIEVLQSMLFQFLDQYDLEPRSRKRKRLWDSGRQMVVASRPRSSGGTQELDRPDINSDAARRARELTEERSSRTNDVALAKSPCPHPNAQTRYFSNWSRIKSGRKEGFDDVYSGLPRSRRKRPTQGDQTSEAQSTRIPSLTMSRTEATEHVLEARLQEDKPEEPNVKSIVPVQHAESLGSSEVYRPDSSHSFGTVFDTISESGPESARLGDDVMGWTNPTTGSTVRINARTGLVVPPSNPQKHGSDTPSVSSKLQSTALLRPTATRRSVSRKALSQKALPDPDSWVGKFLEEWDNPVIRKAEEAISVLSLQELDSATSKPSLCSANACGMTDLGNFELAFGASHSAHFGKLSKGGLKEAEVLGQVDQKFILVRMRSSSEHDRSGSSQGDLLVLVDQHAADERCRIENLLEELCMPSSSLDHGDQVHAQVRSTILPQPIRFSVSKQESRLFQMYAQHFASWGIAIRVRTLSSRPLSSSSTWSSDQNWILSVTALPPTIVERCKLEPNILVDLLRVEIWALDDKNQTRSSRQAEVRDSKNGHSEVGGCDGRHRWLSRIGNCPHKILEMLNSRACRSAVMFNDTLSLDDCRGLVTRLAECCFPFQCAHGRPSMIPIADLGGLGQSAGLVPERGLHDRRLTEQTFADAYTAWK